MMNSTRVRATGEADLTSMVDVTFLVLIFFIVTTAFHLQKAVELPVQRADVGLNYQNEPEPEAVNLQVLEDGSYWVMTPRWEREALGRQSLNLVLTEAFQDADSSSLRVEVSGMARLGDLVGALDTGTGVGFEEIRVTQVEET